MEPTASNIIKRIESQKTGDEGLRILEPASVIKTALGSVPNVLAVR